MRFWNLKADALGQNFNYKIMFAKTPLRAALRVTGDSLKKDL